MAGRRFSMVLPQNIERQLLEIQNFEGLTNPSQAVRHAIRVCHEQLKAPAKDSGDAGMHRKLEKILILQKYILVEIGKLHDGQTNLTAEGEKYLEKLNHKVKKHLQEVSHVEAE